MFFFFVIYRSLERVIHNCERGATRINCAKLRSLSAYGMSPISEHVKDYFPHTHIYILIYSK
jgi:hypothetical protein